MKNFEKYKDEIMNEYDSSIACDVRRLKGIEECAGVKCDNCNREALRWLLSEYKRPILDDVEKEYLQAVIKPFGSKIKYISKSDGCCKGKQFILIEFYKGDHFIFPYFEANSMYKGMELNKEYTLKELGL